MNWTKDDLHAYLLIWFANADFIEFEEDVELILSQIDTKRYIESLRKTMTIKE